MQALRRFAVQVQEDAITDGSFTPGADYKVLALDEMTIGDDCCSEPELFLSLLLADDQGDLCWVSWDAVKVTNIE